MVFVVNRLIAGLCDIDDAQPTEPHRNRVIRIKAAAVWSAVRDHLGHIFQNFIPVENLTGKAAYSTHKLLLLCFTDPCSGRTLIPVCGQKLLRKFTISL